MILNTVFFTVLLLTFRILAPDNSMFWQENTDTPVDPTHTPVIDMGFSITCRQLPLDHAARLAEEILSILPWLEEESLSGIHCIRGATSGNGWNQPEHVVHLSRRTRLYLRIPEYRQQDVLALVGQQLLIGGDSIAVGKAQPRPMQALPCLYAHHNVTETRESESAFMQRIASNLAGHNIKVRKMLCGLTHTVTSKRGPLQTRSVMVADLEPAESLALQCQVIGHDRLLGCGLFIPHKGIKAVNTAEK